MPEPIQSLPRATGKWTLWLDQQPPKGVKVSDFKDQLKQLGCFSNNVQLSKFYNSYIERRLRSSLPQHSNFRLFAEGCSPLWEDARNIDGGKLLISVPKTQTMRVWAETVALIFAGTMGPTVNGAVLSFRPRCDMVSVWTSGTHQKDIDAMTDLLRSTLNVDVQFLVHRWSVDRNSKKTVTAPTAPTAVRRRTPLVLNKKAAPVVVDAPKVASPVVAATIAEEEVTEVSVAEVALVEPSTPVDVKGGHVLFGRQFGLLLTLGFSVAFYGALYMAMPLLE